MKTGVCERGGLEFRNETRTYTFSTSLALIIFLFLAAGLCGQNTNVSVRPIPDWVRLSEWNSPTNQLKSEKSEGSRYLLYEWQENPQQEEKFTRVVLLMENETGVQDSGSLSFNYDPSFQELFLHRIQIYRGGKALERLDPSKIKIIQPEPDLDGHLFTGEQTAVLFVEDLRIGDVLEYVYTIRGANPILEGHYSTHFTLRSGVPVDRQRMRVVWSSTKPLYLQQHLTEVVPKTASWNEGTEYVWDLADLQSIPFEDAIPAGHELYPYVELSDFNDWSRVVQWALPLYSVVSTNLPPELQELIAKWQDGAASNEEKARRALQFVQDELRYTGIELGPDSFRPAQPSETFRLRYGDCKGKASLLCAVLHEMNIDAHPALVNTSARETVAQRLPSPFAFNHVIVKLLIDGRTVWVDPTRSHQGGLLWDRVLPRYGKALIIKEGVAALEDVQPNTDKALQRVTSMFSLKDYTSPVSLTVKTAYHGSEADSMREYFARTDTKEIVQDYLNFYARYYPGVHEPRPLEVHDDRIHNVFEVTEHYQIRDFWKLDRASQRWETAFYAKSLDEMLTDPDTRIRKMPLRISYPLRREEEIAVHLPDDGWNISVLERAVEHEAFSFHYCRKYSGSTVRFQYNCETKAPEVPADKVAGYLAKLEEMQALLGDTLYRPNNRPEAILARINWLMIVVAGFGIVAALMGCIWVWRTTRVPETVLTSTVPSSLHGEANLQGLGGWLILVALGLCLGPVWRLVTLVCNWEGFFSTHTWQAVAVPTGEQYHPLWGPLLIFELLGNTWLLSLNVLVLCLFFAKRKAFPTTYITLMVLNVVFLLIDGLAGDMIPQVMKASGDSSSKQLSSTIMPAIIWCSYMLKSRRVKATFVR